MAKWKEMHGARVAWPCDMRDDMLESAIVVTKKHMNAVGDLESSGATIAQLVKEEFDEEWGMKWHCMIGTSFGCHATHESGCFVHFYVGEWAVMLFKA